MLVLIKTDIESYIYRKVNLKAKRFLNWLVDTSAAVLLSEVKNVQCAEKS